MEVKIIMNELFQQHNELDNCEFLQQHTNTNWIEIHLVFSPALPVISPCPEWEMNFYRIDIAETALCSFLMISR